MHKIVPVLVIMLSGCAQHNADRVSIDFEPMYPQEMPLVETNNRSGTIFNAARVIYFLWKVEAQHGWRHYNGPICRKFSSDKITKCSHGENQTDGVRSFFADCTRNSRVYPQNWLLVRQNTFSGSGSSAQSNSLNGQVSVHVVRVFQNGNLEILGQKKLTLNNGDEYIRVHGIVRPKDINEKNIVSSDRIANANIQYIGAGDIAAVR